MLETDDILIIESEKDKIIYPTNIKKYTGHIYQRYTTSFQIQIKYGEFKKYETYRTYDEAFEELKKINIEEKLPIRNLIYPQYKNRKLDHYEIDIKHDNRTKIDIEDLEKIEEHNWHIREGYAVMEIKKKEFKLHNYVKNFTPTETHTIDHINRDRLDNRKFNLKIADNQIQCINRKIQKSNTSGHVGVFHDKSKDRWMARWQENGKRKTKSFSVNLYGYEKAKQMAVNYRLKMEHKLKHYKEALHSQKILEPEITFEEN